MSDAGRSGKRSIEDESVVRELRAYQAALESGDDPERARILALFPDLAEELAGCLDGLDLMYHVAPQLQDGTADEVGVGPEAAIGDFRILREVGRGGMGVVYEAEQISLDRRVALKVLPFAAVLDARYLQRFKNEAQAAAHLHHTNIVPVHAVGAERGVHYYAMQFIEGRTLAGLIDELRAFSTNGEDGDSSPALQSIAKERTTESPRFCRAVAHLGIQAAEALEYAHESGVIHRDVKPANLIVDGNGHLWITDFGLASTRKDTGLTMTGDLVGTLRYMSPEQTRGKRVPVDHRTDIYSLAVTLYELLTLRPAFPGDDQAAVMQAIALREPARPRALNPVTPAALETILLKAMAKDPADRYATAQELADDLRRFIEDRPIHARRPSFAQRAKQWGRRHRSAVWAALAVLVLAVAGLTVGTILLARSRNELQAAHAELETNYRNTRAIVDRVLTRAAEELDDQPQMEELRRDLLEEALAFYRDFLKKKGDEPEVRVETMRAHERLGNTLFRLARFKEALAEADVAVGLGEAIGDLPEARLVSAELQHLRAMCLSQLGRVEEAIESARAVVEYRKRMADADPSAAATFQLSIAHASMAGYLTTAGRLENARQSSEKAISLKLELLGGEHEPADLHGRLGDDYMRFGLLLKQLSQWAAAEEAYKNAAAQLKKALEKEPRARRHRELLGASYLNLANVLPDTRSDEAMEAIRNGLEINEALASEYPTMPRFPLALAAGHMNLSRSLFLVGRPEEAKVESSRAVAVAESVDAEFPDVPEHEAVLASALWNRARDLDSRTEGNSKRQDLERALELRHRVLDKIPNRPDQRSWLALNCRALADCLMETGHKQEAGPIYDEGLAEARRLVKDFPDSLSLKDTLARLLRAAALQRVSLQDLAGARVLLADAADLYERDLKSYPQVLRFPGDLYLTFQNLAWVLEQLGETKAAADVLRRGLAVLGDHAETLPGWANFVAQSNQVLSRCVWDSEPEEADRACRTALRWFKKDIEAGPHGDPPDLVGFTSVCSKLAEVAAGREGEQAAEAYSAEARTILARVPDEYPDNPEIINQAAWLLAAHSDPGIRDPAAAVRTARRAVERVRSGSASDEAAVPAQLWNTLGVALCAAGRHEEGLKALERSMELTEGGSAIDWFFYAMAKHRLGHKDAREWFDKAVTWMEKNAPDDPELTRFRAEADEVLGLHKPLSHTR